MTRAQSLKRNFQPGFTLVEILVVLVIVGLMAATASIGFERISNQRLYANGEQLAAWLVRARDRALFDGGIYAVTADSERLSLAFWAKDRWVEVIDDSWQSEEGVSFEFQVEESEYAITQQSPIALNEDERVIEPIMIFLPGGAASFGGSVTLMENDEWTFYSIEWNLAGEISASRIER